MSRIEQRLPRRANRRLDYSNGVDTERPTSFLEPERLAELWGSESSNENATERSTQPLEVRYSLYLNLIDRVLKNSKIDKSRPNFKFFAKKLKGFLKINKAMK